MIKKSLLVGIAASAMLFTACTSSYEVPEKNASNENQIQLVLNSAGNGLVSRAAREVYTTVSTDNVDHVTMKLYRFVGGEWVLQQGCFESDEIEWTGTTADITSSVVKVKNLDSNTQYRVIAYGYNGSPCPYTVNDQGTTLIATEAPAQIEELFAGTSDTFQTDSDGRVTELINVEMTRMVAGVLAYFYNIPILKILPGTTDLHVVRNINIYTAAKTTGFTFPTKGLYNGCNQEEGKTKIMVFDLKELIPNYDEQVAAADNNFAAMYTIPAMQGAVSTLPNSVIKGAFLLPFATHVESNTLMVELEDAEGNVLKHWDVSYAKSTGNPFQFDIQRNSFYALGKKVNDQATLAQPGEDPSDPNSPADNPLDLSSVELTVSLIDKWDKVFYMTLD